MYGEKIILRTESWEGSTFKQKICTRIESSKAGCRKIVRNISDTQECDVTKVKVIEFLKKAASVIQKNQVNQKQKIVRFGIQKVTVPFGEKNFNREMDKEARLQFQHMEYSLDWMKRKGGRNQETSYERMQEVSSQSEKIGSWEEVEVSGRESEMGDDRTRIQVEEPKAFI